MKRGLRGILLAVLLIAMASPVQAGSRREESEAVEIIMSQGQVIQGHIRAMQNSRYLVQGIGEKGEALFYDVPGDQIKSVAGSGDLPAYDAARRVVDYQLYERVYPSGNVESWSRLQGRNESWQLLTRLSWGVADWEAERTRRMHVVDAYGNTLGHHFEMKGGQRVVIVELAVPVAPQEEYVLTVAYKDSERARLENGVWTFRFVGDFPEDRLLRRKVILPVGAELLEVKPALSHKTFEHEGAPLVYWKRFFFKNETAPMTLRYRLP